MNHEAISKKEQLMIDSHRQTKLTFERFLNQSFLKETDQQTESIWYKASG